MSEQTDFVVGIVTFGYSDSEDRLWLRLVVRDHPDVQYWVTRRFLLRWINTLSETLYDTVKVGTFPAPDSREKCVGFEFLEALNRTPDTPPPPPEEGDDVPRMMTRGVLNSIRINADPQLLTIYFLTNDDETYRLELDRVASYSLLNGLMLQVGIAQWNRPDEDNLRRAWSSPEYLEMLRRD